MWLFTISRSTRNTKLTKDGIFVSNECYSGSLDGDGYNNAALSHVKNVGPLPEGMYTIEGPPYDHKEKGPYVLRLQPYSSNEMFNRDGFLIHGKPLPPRDINSGSDGCICADHATRMRIYQSGDIVLQCLYVD